MPVTKNKPAPYAPPTAILDIIERYRNRGLPTPVTADVLGRAGISDSLIPRTLPALQSLDLIDATGKPTPTLEGIRLAPEAEYRNKLGEWLKGAYADVFAFVDPAKDGDTAIRDAFRSYDPVGQQPRMVTLFYGLCAAAGLAPQSNNQPRQARPRPAGPSNPSIRQTQSAKPPKPAATYDVHGHIPAPLAGLLTGLPTEGKGWTREARERFIKTFGAVLDFCFPIIEDDDEDTDSEAATTGKVAAA
jgi:Family of unknown function (DUF5343)